MIRFIDLGDQICEGRREFAFFDTITDTFVPFGEYIEEYTFDSIDAFKSALDSSSESTQTRRRWLEYIPEDFFTQKNQ